MDDGCDLCGYAYCDCFEKCKASRERIESHLATIKSVLPELKREAAFVKRPFPELVVALEEILAALRLSYGAYQETPISPDQKQH
jgi:hypothetical protein